MQDVTLHQRIRPTSPMNLLEIYKNSECTLQIKLNQVVIIGDLNVQMSNLSQLETENGQLTYTDNLDTTENSHGKEMCKALGMVHLKHACYKHLK